MKVALVLPEWRIENPYPPLGLAYIGSVLEKNDHTVKIFDLTLEHNISEESKANDIVDFSPDIIGISCMSHNYSNAAKIALYLKTMTGAPIVFGGPHPTIMPEEVLRDIFIDFVVMGEGEETFLKICQNLSKNKFDGIDGLCYKDNGKIIIQPKNRFIEDLDNIPFPARHLLRLDDYKLFDDYGNKMATIITSRGCPYWCTYCYKGLFGKTYRQRSPKNVIDEIKYCKDNLGYSSFYFIDDLFTLNSKRIEQLTEAIRKENLNIRWQCLARVNNATSQMFTQMKGAGCYKVHFGIESGNQNVLNRVKKGINLNQIRNAVKYCKDAGIKTKGYFMLGMPGDTTATMQDTLNIAKELKLDDAMFSVTTPFPGTELWRIIDKSKIGTLSDAFYYLDYSDEFNIFYNVSDSTDAEVIDMLKKASKISEDIKTKSFCNKLFGEKMGFLAWHLKIGTLVPHLIKIPYLKKAGKIFLDLRN